MAVDTQVAGVQAGDAVAGLVFAHLGTGWLVPLVLACAIAVAWWAWRTYGPAPGQGLTAAIARASRACGLALLVLLAAGPGWRTASTTVTPGTLVVAVDASASMALTDGPAGQPRIAAAGRLGEALTARVDPRQATLRWSLVAAAGRNGDVDPTVLAGAAAATFAVGPSSPIADDLGRLVAGTRPDALVVVTDGRITDGASFGRLVEQWRGRELRLAILATGTDAVVPDLALDEVVVNREAALGEREPVAVRVSHRGLPPGPLRLTLRVDDEPPQESDMPQGTTAEAAVMATAEGRAEVVFAREGQARLTVTVTAGGRSVSQVVTVSVRERKLSVLLLDGRPRYEVRYLREAFKRDKTVTVHAYLAEGRWRRWGNEGPDRLPLTNADLVGYDVVVLGDVAPDAFRAADLANLESAVRKGGTGLVWLPGETGAIAGFTGQKLGELLPVELGDAATVGRGYLSQGRALSRSDVAQRLGLLEPGETPWERLPQLLGAAPINTVRPGAEILASDQEGKPLVVTRAYGAGRAVFIAVDDTWRWRREAGDRYLHRFHSQLLRFAAANHRGDRRAWRLAANPRRAVPGEPLLLALSPLRPDAEIPARAVARLVPTGDAAGRREMVVPLARDGDGFAARLAAPAPGTWELALAAGPDLAAVEGGDLLVVPPGAERRDPRADIPSLMAFAAAMGGELYTSPEELAKHFTTDLRHSESRSALIGLWDTPWALALVVLFFALDWALRRWHRLP